MEQKELDKLKKQWVTPDVEIISANSIEGGTTPGVEGVVIRRNGTFYYEHS